MSTTFANDRRVAFVALLMALAAFPCLATAQVSLELELMNLARQSELFGRVTEAERLYTQVIATNPANQMAHHRLGVLAAQSNDLNRAITHFTAAERAGPPSPKLLNDFGAALYLKGNLALAEQKLRVSLAIAPDHMDARHNLELVKAQQAVQAEARARAVAEAESTARARLEAEARAKARTLAEARLAANARAIAEARAAAETAATARAVADSRAARHLRAIATAHAQAEMRAPAVASNHPASRPPAAHQSSSPADSPALWGRDGPPDAVVEPVHFAPPKQRSMPHPMAPPRVVIEPPEVVAANVMIEQPANAPPAVYVEQVAAGPRPAAVDRPDSAAGPETPLPGLSEPQRRARPQSRVSALWSWLPGLSGVEQQCDPPPTRASVSRRLPTTESSPRRNLAAPVYW